jgi:hypothetical protein
MTNLAASTKALGKRLTVVTKLRGTVRIVPPGSIDQHGAIVDVRTMT